MVEHGYPILAVQRARCLERFVNSSVPEESSDYTRFYFFNITNLEDVRKTGAKPELVRFLITDR